MLSVMPNSPASFEKFLLSARLGDLRCGLAEPEVVTILSNPKQTEDYPNGSTLWRYGTIECRFFAGQLESFGFYYAWNKEAVPELVNVEGYLPGPETPIQEVKEFMINRNIPFQTGEGDLMFKTQAGVWIFTTAEIKLMSIVAENPSGRTVLEKQFGRSLRS
jgi:hypothetical protein